jgi:hypothetical protein
LSTLVDTTNLSLLQVAVAVVEDVVCTFDFVVADALFRADLRGESVEATPLTFLLCSSDPTPNPLAPPRVVRATRSDGKRSIDAVGNGGVGNGADDDDDDDDGGGDSDAEEVAFTNIGVVVLTFLNVTATATITMASIWEKANILSCRLLILVVDFHTVFVSFFLSLFVMLVLLGAIIALVVIVAS